MSSSSSAKSEESSEHEVVTIIGGEVNGTSSSSKKPAKERTSTGNFAGSRTRESGCADHTVPFSSKVRDLSSSFACSPPPPRKLWDTDDVQYLNKVSCRVSVMMTHIDPKNGMFEGRMTCSWHMRTLECQERTDPLLRVPGIRCPSLACSIEESRMWRNFNHDSATTVAWSGITVMSFYGNEVFEVHDFPYDRQVVDLNVLDFVWRDDKDTDRYFEEMKVVSLSSETQSMMPEWECCPAIVEARNVSQLGSGPSSCSRFIVKLRLQRKERYYITHIFMVTYLITSAALFTLGLSPGAKFVGDRLIILTSGLLSLVSFKYSIAHDLPSVPYPTFASTYLACQVYTLVAIAGETVLTYKLRDDMDSGILATFEDILLGVLLLLWLSYFLYAAFGKKRRTWEDVLSSQTDSTEVTGNALNADGDSVADSILSLARRNYELFYGLQKGASSLEQLQMSKGGIDGWAKMPITTFPSRRVIAYNRLTRRLQGISKRLRHVKVKDESMPERKLPKTLSL